MQPGTSKRPISRVGMGLALGLGLAACGEASTEQQIADTMRRTEDIRELTALQTPPYRFLPADRAFDDLLDGWRASPDAQEAVVEADVLKRLGLLPPDLDILEVLEWSTRTGVLGYYDPDTEMMTVVAEEDSLEPADLMILAHEHAHALQDQHFDLKTRIDTLDDDEAAAIDALTEGEATLVMAIWARKRLGDGDLESLDASMIPTDVQPLDEVPPILIRGGEFPYIDGAAFVYSIWEQGGWGAVDDLWAAPPVSTEQILHPERYPDDVPVIIRLPDVAAAMGEPWATSSEMTLGEMQIAVLLADGVPWDDETDQAFAFPELENAAAAAGWGGDRLAHVEGPDGAWVVTWQTAWDSRSDAEEFAASAADALRDVPYSWSVLEGVDISADAIGHPVLLLGADTQETKELAVAAIGPFQPRS